MIAVIYKLSGYWALFFVKNVINLKKNNKFSKKDLKYFKNMI